MGMKSVEHFHQLPVTWHRSKNHSHIHLQMSPRIAGCSPLLDGNSTPISDKIVACGTLRIVRRKVSPDGRREASAMAVAIIKTTGPIDSANSTEIGDTNRRTIEKITDKNPL